MHTKRSLNPVPGPRGEPSPWQLWPWLPFVLWSPSVGPDSEAAEVVERENGSLNSLFLSFTWEPKLHFGSFSFCSLALRDSISISPATARMCFPTHLCIDSHVPVQRGFPVSALWAVSAPSLSPSRMSSVTLGKMVNVSGPPFPCL